MASITSDERKAAPKRTAASTSKATTAPVTPTGGVLVRDADHYRDGSE
jgi:hypothetical protein